MKIATRLKLTVLVPAAIAFLVGLALIFSYQMVQDAHKKDRAAQRIITGMHGLSSFVSEYLLYHDARPLQQFLAEHDIISRRIATTRFAEAQQQQVLNDIRRDMELMKGSFLKLASNHERYRSVKGDALMKEVENRLAGRVLVWSRDVASQAAYLEKLVDEELTTTQRRINLFILALLAATTLIFGILLTGITRNITASLLTLRKGAEAIGAGNLHYRIDMAARDEIGDLSRSFDHMAEQLQAVTVSKHRLQREVEEREKVEVALREQREWLDVTLNSIGDAVLATDMGGRISFLNPVASTLTGWTVEEAQGEPIRNVLRTVNEFTREPAEDIAERVMADGCIIQMANHTALVRRDGSEIPIEDSAAPIKDSAGNLLGVVIVFHDVTEKRRSREALRQSEEKLRIVAEFTYDWECWRSPDNRFLYVSPSCERITGYSREEFLEDPGLYERIIYPEDRDRVLKHMREDLFDTEPCEFEFRILCRDGRKCWIGHSCQPVLDEKGQMLGRRASNRDITKRKQAEEMLQGEHEELELRIAERTEQLHRYAAKLEWRNRELQEFATVASHDLQEPLRKIQTFGEMIQGELAEVLSDSARDYLSRMIGAANRMQELIKALLAYSRVSAKASPFERIELKPVVEKVVEDLYIPSDCRKPVIEIGELPAIDTDPVQIAQLLQNLIANAVRYAKNGQVCRIKIWGREIVQNENQENRWLELRVQDNGIGFDMCYLDKIFRPFERLHGRGEYEGTGMGLAICSKIVERHNGKITAQSRPGEGATFIVTFPMRQTCEQKQPTE